MKHICLIFIFLGFFAQSQEIKVKLIKHSWANGCYGCGHGCNYTLTIIPRNEKITHLSIKSACVDTHYFSSLKLKSKATKNNTITLYFGWAEESTKDEQYPGKIEKKSGKSPAYCNEEGLVIIINGEKKKIKFSEIKVIPAEPRP